MSKVTKFSEVVSKMMEAVTIGKDSKDIEVLDESAMSEAEELLNQIIVETARDWWAQLESAEDSLADMSDEISFSELSADSSHVGSPALDVSAGAADDAPASLESMLESEEFDLDSIFEMADDDEDEDADEKVEEGMHYEDGEEFGPDDGDDQFDDLMRGDDESGLGDDGMDGELDMGDDDDMDAIGGGDEFGADDGMMDDDLGGDFDFDFLDDDGADFGDGEPEGDDEFGPMGDDDDMEEMNHLDGVRESDDDEDEDDDKEKDKD